MYDARTYGDPYSRIHGIETKLHDQCRGYWGPLRAVRRPIRDHWDLLGRVGVPQLMGRLLYNIGGAVLNNSRDLKSSLSYKQLEPKEGEPSLPNKPS